MKPPRQLQLAVDALADEVPHGHLLASTDGAGLLLAAAEMIREQRKEIERLQESLREEP